MGMAVEPHVSCWLSPRACGLVRALHSCHTPPAVSEHSAPMFPCVCPEDQHSQYPRPQLSAMCNEWTLTCGFGGSLFFCPCSAHVVAPLSLCCVTESCALWSDHALTYSFPLEGQSLGSYEETALGKWGWHGNE